MILEEEYLQLSIRAVFALQMIAKGRNVSSLFPAVVKNVVSKNVEVGPRTHFHIETMRHSD